MSEARARVILVFLVILFSLVFLLMRDKATLSQIETGEATFVSYSSNESTNSIEPIFTLNIDWSGRSPASTTTEPPIPLLPLSHYQHKTVLPKTENKKEKKPQSMKPKKMKTKYTAKKSIRNINKNKRSDQELMPEAFGKNYDSKYYLSHRDEILTELENEEPNLSN